MNKRILLTSCGLALAFATGGAAMAQTAPEAGGIEEVVVTAQKRSENLQNTPITVTAVQSETLARAGVRDFTNINKIAPDITVNSTTGSTNIGVRGIRALASGPTNETPTAVHLDGVYLSRAAGLQGLFYDVERLEVLKGPQGTLYGRNAAAGVINIITNRAKFGVFSVSGLTEVGNYDLRRGEYAVNVPVGEDFAMRAAFRYYTRGGYYDGGFEDADQKGLRLSAGWRITPKATLSMSGDYEINDRNGTAPNVVIETRYRQAAANGALNLPIAVTALSNPYDFDARLYPLGIGRSNEYQRSRGVQVTLDYDLDFATLTTQVGNRNVRQEGLLLSAANPLTPATLPGFSYIPSHSDTTSIETRLASNSSRPLQWVAGLYFFTESADGTNCSLGFTGPLPPPNSICGLDIRTISSLAQSYAGFGQATWTPAFADERLHLTAGLRYNADYKKQLNVSKLPGGTSSKANNGDWKATTFKLGAAYDITSRNMVYANTSTGFKAGGFAYGSQPEFQPENIQAWEVGTKNRFFDGKLQVNVDAYRYNYKNIQTNVTVPSPTPPSPPFLDLTVVSVGKAHYQGGGLETIYALTDNDRLDLSVQYLKARYANYVVPARFSSAAPLDMMGRPTGQVAGVNSGLQVPNTPKWSGRAGYGHTFDLAAGSVEARADVQFSGKTPLALANPGTIQDYVRDSYAKGDISLRYEPTDGRWNITGYVNNVTKERIVAGAAWQTNGLVTGSYMEPRTYGVIVGANF